MYGYFEIRGDFDFLASVQFYVDNINRSGLKTPADVPSICLSKVANLLLIFLFKHPRDPDSKRTVFKHSRDSDSKKWYSSIQEILIPKEQYSSIQEILIPKEQYSSVQEILISALITLLFKYIKDPDFGRPVYQFKH